MAGKRAFASLSRPCSLVAREGMCFEQAVAVVHRAESGTGTGGHGEMPRCGWLRHLAPAHSEPESKPSKIDVLISLLVAAAAAQPVAAQVDS